jgi:hypothetical protein
MEPSSPGVVALLEFIVPAQPAHKVGNPAEQTKYY